MLDKGSKIEKIGFTREKKFSIAIYSIILGVALVVIDYLNLFSRLDIFHDRILRNIFLITSIFILFLLLWKGRIMDYIKAPIITIFDKIISILLLSFIIYGIVGLGVNILAPYKLTITLILLVGIYFLICKRSKTINKNDDRYKYYNVLDLQDIYNDNFEISDDRPTLIEEKEVSYDLLNRDIVIDYLHNILVETSSRESFIVGVNGSWGSGKSTIIENVKNKINNDEKNVIVIDDFEPWIFEN